MVVPRVVVVVARVVVVVGCVVVVVARVVVVVGCVVVVVARVVVVVGCVVVVVARVVVVVGCVVVVVARVVVVVGCVVVVVARVVVVVGCVVVVVARVVVVVGCVVVVVARVVVVVGCVVVVVARVVVVVVAIVWQLPQMVVLPVLTCHVARLLPPAAPVAVWKFLWQLLLQVAGTTVPAAGEPVVWQVEQPTPAWLLTAWIPVAVGSLGPSPVVAWHEAQTPFHVELAPALFARPTAMASAPIRTITRTKSRYFVLIDTSESSLRTSRPEP